jgi:hypothetical protein
MSSALREVWEDVPTDPDPASDLGYEYGPLSIIGVEEDGEQYIFLPREEDHLSDSEFIIAGTEAVRDLGDCR